jgi:hypothetical protein
MLKWLDGLLDSNDREIRRLKGLLEERYDFPNVVGKSGKMKRVLEVVSRIAKTDSTVYIHGESGTGKELIANAIHYSSPRKNGPFVKVNCGASRKHSWTASFLDMSGEPSPERSDARSADLSLLKEDRSSSMRLVRSRLPRRSFSFGSCRTIDSRGWAARRRWRWT